jgi:hypothetical protein
VQPALGEVKPVMNAMKPKGSTSGQAHAVSRSAAKLTPVNEFTPVAWAKTKSGARLPAQTLPNLAVNLAKNTCPPHLIVVSWGVRNDDHEN